MPPSQAEPGLGRLAVSLAVFAGHRAAARPHCRAFKLAKLTRRVGTRTVTVIVTVTVTRRCGLPARDQAAAGARPCRPQQPVRPGPAAYDSEVHSYSGCRKARQWQPASEFSR